MQSGQIRALAVASTKRLADLPDLPTVAEAVPGFAAMGWFPLLAPTGTPQPIVDKVNTDLRTILAQAELQKRFLAVGTFVRPMSPQQTSDFIANEQKVWRPVVRAIGFGKK
jgi:tripartite-type tricarboxylate transporter receptor subunit TctC